MRVRSRTIAGGLDAGPSSCTSASYLPSALRRARILKRDIEAAVRNKAAIVKGPSALIVSPPSIAASAR